MYPNETLKGIFEFSKMKYRILLWSVLYESHKSILADNYSSQAIFPGCIMLEIFKNEV